MEERYTRLFSLTENLYTNESPIIIEAGALLKDTVTGTVIAQLKFKNITDKVIKAVKVSIISLDTVGRIIGEPTVQQYLDFSAKRDESFGQKTAVMLPDDNTRAFSVSVNEVAFADNSVWSCNSDVKWETLPKQKALFVDDTEMLKQYQMEVNRIAEHELLEVEDLWFCVCGAVNRKNERICHICHTTFDSMSGADVMAIKDRCDKRVEEEARILEEEAQEAAEIRIKKEKQLAKLKKRIGVVIATIVLAVTGLLVTKNIIIPTIKYKTAISLMEKREYDEAVEAFIELGNYKDSMSLIDHCRSLQIEEERDKQYKEAEKLLETGNFEEAIEIFSALAYYKDSSDRVIECIEKNAAFEEKEGNYDKAIELYLEAKNKKEANRVRYDYVKNHMNDTDKVTAKYLLCLIDEKYEDAEDIYNSLYEPLQIEVLVNSGYEDYETCFDMFGNQSNMYKWDKGAPYLHFKVCGGPPGVSISINVEKIYRVYRQTLTSKSSSLVNSDYEWHTEILSETNASESFKWEITIDVLNFSKTIYVFSKGW